MEITINHQQDKGRFSTIVKGKEAYISYKLNEQGIIEVNGTHIPTELRGKGIAGQMAIYVCNFAKKEQMKLKPSCPYIAQYIENNPTIWKETTLA